MILYKRDQLRIQEKLKKKVQTENLLLEKVQEKEQEIFELKGQLKSLKPLGDSMALTENEDVSIEEEVRIKLYELENENLELRQQLNKQIIDKDLNEADFEKHKE